MRFLGITPSRFERLYRKRIIKPLGQNWFAYADLERAVETIRKERDGGNVIELDLTHEENQGVSEAGRAVGSKGDKSPYRPTKELLRAQRS